MNTITKPILFLTFILCFMYFLNLTLLFVTINKTDMVLNRVSYIVEKNGSDKNAIKSEVDALLSSYKTNYEVSYDYEENDDFRDVTKITIKTMYKYIGRDKQVEIEKSNVVMNTQM